MDPAASLDRDEIEKFNDLASQWWDPEGPMRPLHQLNPLRIAYIRDRLCSHFEKESSTLKPLRGLDILDLGCGGGLLSEPLARLGATVTAIDAGADILGAAALHGEMAGLDIDYRLVTAEEWAGGGHRYDAVVSMEVVEHVADLGSFTSAIGSLVKPGGAVVMATINRTAKSYALAIVGAERIMRWLPPGTHEWEKFVKPVELSCHLRNAGIELTDTVGVSYRPGRGWHVGRDKSVNYMAFAIAATRS